MLLIRSNSATGLVILYRWSHRCSSPNGIKMLQGIQALSHQPVNFFMLFFFLFFLGGSKWWVHHLKSHGHHLAGIHTESRSIDSLKLTFSLFSWWLIVYGCYYSKSPFFHHQFGENLLNLCPTTVSSLATLNEEALFAAFPTGFWWISTPGARGKGRFRYIHVNFQKYRVIASVTRFDTFPFEVP